MSAQYLDIFIKPKDDEASKNISQFVGHVAKQEYEKITDMDTENLLDDIEHYFDAPIDMKVRDGVINLCFDTFSSFESDCFMEFLQFLGAQKLEATIYDSQVGENYYYKDTDFIENYSDYDWKWIPVPEPDQE